MHRLRSYLPTLAFLALLGGGVFLYVTAQPSLPDRGPTYTVLGQVGEIDHRFRELHFKFNNAVRIYRIATADDAVYDALRGSVRTGNPVEIQVTPYGAQFPRGSTASQFWVESLEYGGKKFGPFTARRRWSWRSVPTNDAALLRAAALSAAKRHDEALAQLDGAVAAGNPGARAALVYRQRALVRERLAYPPGRGINEHDDRLLVQSLADLEQAAKLEPDERRVVEAQAAILYKLGAYPEALALHEELEQRWAVRPLQAVAWRAQTYRQMGQNEDALRVLDAYADEHGPSRGMKFHYQRAVTLNKLGRHEEAARAITMGLEKEPDYRWALVERSCARARLGQLAEARADLLNGRRLWEQFRVRSPTTYSNERVRYINVIFDIATQALDAALARTPQAPVSTSCSDDFDNDPMSLPRARSDFLPKGSPASEEPAPPPVGRRRRVAG